MELNEVVAHGAPSGARAIGIIRWTPTNDEKTWAGEKMLQPGVERTDYLVDTQPRHFLIVGHGIPLRPIGWSFAERAEVWYW